VNFIEHAYLQGKQAAEAKFAPVAAPTPKGPATPATQTASTPATNQVKPAVKAPASLGLTPKASLPGMQSMSSSSLSSSTSPKSTLAASMPTVGAPALAQQSAMQFASDTINSAGKQMLGALPKMADFNFGMHPDPSTTPDHVPKGDNGRRQFGTQFNDPRRPARDVDQAFNGLHIQKNTDVLNEMGQMEFGAPSSPA
jgi:hypothetical protein